MNHKLKLVKEIATMLDNESTCNASYETILTKLLPHYGLLSLTLDEVGFLLDVTRERVRQIERNGLENISLGHKRLLKNLEESYALITTMREVDYAN